MTKLCQVLIEQQSLMRFRQNYYCIKKIIVWVYFIFLLIASTELYLFSTIIIANWRFSLGCRGRSIDFPPRQLMEAAGAVK